MTILNDLFHVFDFDVNYQYTLIYLLILILLYEDLYE